MLVWIFTDAHIVTNRLLIDVLDYITLLEVKNLLFKT